jgi:hypothetical protein
MRGHASVFRRRRPASSRGPQGASQRGSFDPPRSPHLFGRGTPWVHIWYAAHLCSEFADLVFPRASPTL